MVCFFLETYQQLHSHVWFFAILQTVAHQALLSMGFSRQEYWSRLLCPPPSDLLDPGIEPKSLAFPTMEGGFFTTSATRKPIYNYISCLIDMINIKCPLIFNNNFCIKVYFVWYLYSHSMCFLVTVCIAYLSQHFIFNKDWI